MLVPQVIDLLGIVARAEAAEHDDPNSTAALALFAQRKGPRDDEHDDV